MSWNYSSPSIFTTMTGVSIHYSHHYYITELYIHKHGNPHIILSRNGQSHSILSTMTAGHTLCEK